MDRRTVLVALGASLTGCLGDDDRPAAGTQSPERTESSAGTTGGSTSTDGTGTSAPPAADERLPLPMEPSDITEAAVSGGPPKDGIPAIDDPSFVDADQAPSGLKPGDPVFGVAMDGEVKAYPQEILVHHEICNDTIAGHSVSVTYCPLTGTPMGFFRGETTFGVSGRLVNNNLIMYDRATETWWPQVLATAVPGAWNENPERRSLREFRVVWTTWDRWREAYPETRLLSRETGYARSYAADPYGSYNPREGYYERNAEPMFPALSTDDRLPPKAVVLGARTSAGAVAFGKEHLREELLVEGRLGETPILAVYDPQLDTAWFYRNPEERSFEYRDGAVVVDGESVSPDSLPLAELTAIDAMWFAWAGFYPDTELHA